MVACGVAGGADITKDLALFHGLAHADNGRAVHVGVQRRISIAVVILAVVDLHVVAPAPVVGRSGDDTAGDGVDFGAARCGVIGAAVAVAAKVAGDVLIGGQRAAKVQRALDGRIAVSLVGGVQRGVQLGSSLIHGLVGFDQGRLVGLDLGIRCGNVGVGLGDILGELIRLAVQRGLLGLQKNQEGIYLAYLTDPAAIAKVLPAPLKPFSVPVVTVSVCHVKEPTFADDYYEAILGVYCTYGTQLGLYPIGLVLGGTGAEMAVQCGRDNGSIPKKLGSEFVIRRNNDHVTAQVCRRGTELVNIDLKIGEYNNAMTGMLYQFPEAGKKTYGGGFYFHLDREPDKEGKSHFQNGALLQNLCEYNYHSWEPGFAAIKLQSSIDDPWGELPIRTVIGGAYSSNDLMVHKLNLCEEIDADVLAPYLLTARYDRTAFMETGRR